MTAGTWNGNPIGGNYIQFNTTNLQAPLTAGLTNAPAGYYLNTIQDIATTSAPTFAGLTVNGTVTVSSTVTGSGSASFAGSLTSLKNTLDDGTGKMIVG